MRTLGEMSEESTVPGNGKRPELEAELSELMVDLRAGGEEAKRILRQHPGLAAAAAFLFGVWLGAKLGK